MTQSHVRLSYLQFKDENVVNLVPFNFDHLIDKLWSFGDARWMVWSYLDEIFIARSGVEMGKSQIDSVAQWCHDGPRAVASVWIEIGEIGTLDDAPRSLQFRITNCNINVRQ